METFAWSKLLETGIPEVDQQHHHLVDLVNELSRSAQSARQDNIDRALQDLAQYTVYHFETEERLMAATGVAKAHADLHRATHHKFVVQVSDWIGRRKENDPVGLGQLLDYLSHWLIFHIMGDDQAMGRQVAAIQAGTPPQAAYDQDRISEDPRTEVLLDSLRHLYVGLTERNEALLRAQQDLQDLNASLEQRVTERTSELRLANERLKEEQEKTLAAEKMASLGRLVAGFSHELNTPIGVALAATSHVDDLIARLKAMIQSDEVDENDLKTLIGALEDDTRLSTSNLKRAADMVMRFKRTSVDQSSEQQRDFDVAELIADVITSLHHLFRGDRIQVHIDCPQPLAAFGQAGALIQVLSNLLQNSYLHAFAEGQQRGEIHLTVSAAGDQIHIDYRDNGQGMSAEVLSHVFEPFQTTRRSKGGSGLGLYMAYNMVLEALHGQIQCSSEPGQGTRFQIEIPRFATPQQAGTARPQ